MERREGASAGRDDENEMDPVIATVRCVVGGRERGEVGGTWETAIGSGQRQGQAIQNDGGSLSSWHVSVVSP